MPKPFDIQREREAIYRNFSGQPGPCPRCGGKLKQRHHMYLVATRTSKHDSDSFMMGSDFGWFCEICPTVVINAPEVSKMLSFQKPGWKVGSEFAVLGLIDLAAVPADKRHLPLGGDDNPIPLVAFAGAPEPAEKPAAPAVEPWVPRRTEESKPKRQHRRRNR